MKKFFLIFIITISNAWAQTTLRIATDGAYPPFSELGDNGEMIGFDIDIANALCAQMQMQCEIKQIEWDGLIPQLKTKKIDAIIASMNATEERKKSISFSEPYYANPAIFVRAIGSEITIDKQGLQGKVIGVLRASVFEDYATQQFADWDVAIQSYSTQENANLDMLSGRIDVLFADKLVLQEGFLQRDIGKGYEQFGAELNDAKYFGEGISIAVRRGEQQLADKFSQAIKEIRANGVYKKINDKYFKYDLYEIIENSNSKTIQK